MKPHRENKSVNSARRTVVTHVLTGEEPQGQRSHISPMYLSILLYFFVLNYGTTDKSNVMGSDFDCEEKIDMLMQSDNKNFSYIPRIGGYMEVMAM